MTLGFSDIASFYKEDLANETGTYVQERALSSGKSVRSVLHEIVGEVAEAVHNVESMLNGAKEQAAWRSFLNGYFYFHILCGRYRISELGIFQPCTSSIISSIRVLELCLPIRV